MVPKLKAETWPCVPLSSCPIRRKEADGMTRGLGRGRQLATKADNLSSSPRTPMPARRGLTLHVFLRLPFVCCRMHSPHTPTHSHTSFIHNNNKKVSKCLKTKKRRGRLYQLQSVHHLQAILHLLVHLFVGELHRGSLCSPVCIGTCSVDHAVLEHRDPPSSASHCWDKRCMTTIPGFTYY